MSNATAAASSSALRAFGGTHPGLRRPVNEDRVFVDPARGIFIVIDGIGGQAAGGRAADVALSTLRARLERETGTPADRVREAIALANNEVFRLAGTRAEWHGMACVLTVALVHDGQVTIGHVGDTRLYHIGTAGLEKITRDHSPVGEREDAREISEGEAMRHPRRHEVYRDVGSEPHEPDDPDFVDVYQRPFSSDAALLLCSDGLTDLVDSTIIERAVHSFAGNPEHVVQTLIAAANDAGGKDNVTVAYVEGATFPRRPGATRGSARGSRSRMALVALFVLALAAGLYAWRSAGFPLPLRPPMRVENAAPRLLTVRPGESIAAALAAATPGTTIVVEPGEYRGRLVLKSDVTLTSRVPRGATVRLPADATSDSTAAITATNVTNAPLSGFRIVGDAATPLSIGIHVSSSSIALTDLDVTGATTAGILFDGGGTSSIIGSDVHDNTGPGLVVSAGAAPRISHNTFSRNGTASGPESAMRVDAGAAPAFEGNVFDDAHAALVAAMPDETRAAVLRHNLLLPRPDPPARRPAGSGARGAQR